VDAVGRPIPDPTENVRALTEAAVKRLDDLRTAEARYNEAEVRHINEMSKLRAEHNGQLRDAESKRIDAIRAVDVGAVNRAAEVSATQATTLAAQVATSAETLRTQVAAAAAAAATALATALEPLNTSIADLRKTQYEQAGSKAQVVETTAGKDSNIRTVGFVVAVGVAIMGLITFIDRQSAPDPVVVTVPVAATP